MTLDYIKMQLKYFFFIPEKLHSQNKFTVFLGALNLYNLSGHPDKNLESTIQSKMTKILLPSVTQ